MRHCLTQQVDYLDGMSLTFRFLRENLFVCSGIPPNKISWTRCGRSINCAQRAIKILCKFLVTGLAQTRPFILSIWSFVIQLSHTISPPEIANCLHTNPPCQLQILCSSKYRTGCRPTLSCCVYLLISAMALCSSMSWKRSTETWSQRTVVPFSFQSTNICSFVFSHRTIVEDRRFWLHHWRNIKKRALKLFWKRNEWISFSRTA